MKGMDFSDADRVDADDVNGIAAPLVAVSPTQIVMLVPGSAGPDFTADAAFEAQNTHANCTGAPAGSPCPNSQLVIMYTNYTAPGVFTLCGNGMGAAADEDSSYNVIGPDNPAKPGDSPMLFVTGLGAVTPSLVDGVPCGITPPWNLADIYNGSSLSVYFDGFASPDISFAGVAPGYTAGLYQINAQIPARVSNGDDYLDILTPDAESEQATLRVVCASGATGKMAGRGRRARSSPIVGRPAARRSR